MNRLGSKGAHSIEYVAARARHCDTYCHAIVNFLMLYSMKPAKKARLSSSTQSSFRGKLNAV